MIIGTNLVLLASFFLFSPQQDSLNDALATITADDCFDKVNVLAAPDMMGRGTLSVGFDKAAAYVEQQLLEYGLVFATGDSFRLPFNLNCLVAADNCLISFPPQDIDPEKLSILDQFAPVVGSAETIASGNAVFVGYAINSRNDRWLDLNPAKVKGKIVFAFTREPRASDAKYKKFKGADPTRYSQLSSKARAVADAGGVGLVLVPDPNLVAEPGIVLPHTTPFVNTSGVEASSFFKRSGFPDIPVMTVSRDFASLLFETDIDKYFAKIEKKLRPTLLSADKKLLVTMNVAFENKDVEAYNLAAMIKGDGSSDETLILGAHLDHVGLDPAADQATMTLRPGADDNASGSASLLEVAQAMAPYKPKHDILFLWFTGEELGLLGSRAYCDKPLVAHEKTIAMFNMDMVGRGAAKKINIGGLWSRPQWEKFIKKQHKRIKSKLKMDNDQGRDLYARSDQYSFHDKGVVGLFFFEADLNENKFYHQPTDVPQSIDSKKMSMISRLFAACAWAVAYDGVRP
ncbi:MAG: M28 family peptidase [Planctomycetes bacterium]|nr:M28 family peptidase [Planctomycetota bacterium]